MSHNIIHGHDNKYKSKNESQIQGSLWVTTAKNIKYHSKGPYTKSPW